MWTLTAIVPATDAPPTLGRCLAAIRAAEETPEEVIVVSEAPARGPAAARNEGARSAVGEVLVFVDADTLVHRDAFSRIRATFAREPGLTALFGSYDDDPEASDAVSSFRNLLHHHVHQDGAGAAETFWAGLGAVRRDTFLQVGGFDEARYARPAIEDVELGLRLVDAGGRIQLDPDLQCTHLKRWSLAEMVRVDFEGRAVPWVELLLERRHIPSVLNLGWRHRLSALASVALVAGALTGRKRTAVLGLASLVALNARLYALLARRRGPARAAAGVGLHAVHHLTAVAATATAIGRHVWAERAR